MLLAYGIVFTSAALLLSLYPRPLDWLSDRLVASSDGAASGGDGDPALPFGSGLDPRVIIRHALRVAFPGALLLAGVLSVTGWLFPDRDLSVVALAGAATLIAVGVWISLRAARRAA